MFDADSITFYGQIGIMFFLILTFAVINFYRWVHFGS